MSQYTMKDTYEIKKSAGIICKNLAPLLGCKVNGKGWAPFTGTTICNALMLTGTECSNVSRGIVTNEVLTYHFDSSVTTKTNELWKKAKEYDASVLNSSYIMYIANQMPTGARITEKLHLTAKYCRYTDSTIFDAIYNNNRIALLPQYYQICHILLSCFTLRYLLFEYVSDVKDLDTMEVNEKVIKRIVENIDYVKFSLAEETSMAPVYEKSFEYIRQHLTTLRKNLLMIQPNILQFFK